MINIYLAEYRLEELNWNCKISMIYLLLQN